MQKGVVLRIEKISPNDGPGLRTVVFLKGCPLHCKWCSTPESHRMKPELFYKKAKCVHCARCIKGCPAGALSVSEDRLGIIRDKNKCIECHHCVDVCITEATGLYGKEMTSEQVLKEVRKESIFHFTTGGGVTLSGGDVLLQADFASEILAGCKDECIHTMAELDMYGNYENIPKVFRYLDGVFCDCKAVDPETHKKWTGVSNETILNNIKRASEEFPEVPMTVRVPTIRGINDTVENIVQTIAFCKTLPSCIALEFLPYHRLGTSTYEYLARKYELSDLEAMSSDHIKEMLGKVDTELLKDLPFEIKIA